MEIVVEHALIGKRSTKFQFSQQVLTCDCINNSSQINNVQTKLVDIQLQLNSTLFSDQLRSKLINLTFCFRHIFFGCFNLK